MEIQFDPAKDRINVAKHGISLARAKEMVMAAVVSDERFEEPRYRAYGLLDGLPHCLAFTLRNVAVRAISLRRTHLKEYRRHVSKV